MIPNTGKSGRKWPCTYGVCKRALGYIIILKALLHMSQVYEYEHLTKLTNMLLWLIFFLWLPIVKCFVLVLWIVQILQFVYLPKYGYQSLEINPLKD